MTASLQSRQAARGAVSHGEFVAAFHRHYTSDPNAQVRLGIHQRSGDLPDPSLPALAARVDEAASLLGKVGPLQGSVEGFDDALDLEIAELKLKHEILVSTYAFNGRTMAQQKPSAGQEIGDPLFLLFTGDPRPPGERLADMTSRLRQVPDFLEAMLARLDTPLRRWVEVERAQVAALPDLLATLEAWASEVGPLDLGRFRQARMSALDALERYGARIAKLPTTTQLHIGEGVAADIIASRGIDLPLAGIHQAAVRFLRETGEAIEALRRSILARHSLPEDMPVAGLQRVLKERHRIPSADRAAGTLARYAAEKERILAFIRERDLFPIPPDQAMEIHRTPRFLEPVIPSGYIAPPAPFREGTRRSQIYLTLNDRTLDDHNALSIPIMLIHEGIPGHHLQLSYAASHPSVIRRHSVALEHAEGWTTMLEGYMLDLGYFGGLSEEARFLALRTLRRLGARAAIDLFLMTGERGCLEVGVDADLAPADPFEASVNLLVAATGMARDTAQAELNWYSKERGYPLSYLVGNVLVQRLKEDMRKTLGRSGLDTDREFHRVFLESGAMPLSLLRRVMAHRGMVPAREGLP